MQQMPQGRNGIDEIIPTRRMRRSRDGFTLVEVIVALALFALIGVAGFSMLSGVLQTQEQTDGRLGRLAEIQTAVFVITTDLDQLGSQIDGGPGVLVFQKIDASGQPIVVRYELLDDGLVRTLSGARSERSQLILPGVQSLGWTYFRRGEGWSNRAAPQTAPPPAPAPVLAAAPPQPPVSAVAMDLNLTGVDGRAVNLRRVVIVPEVQP